METFLQSYRKNGNLHHAHVFEGEKSVLLPALLKFLENDLKISTKNNPDFTYQNFETFTIDDGRSLQEMQLRRAIDGKKVFIISTRFITTEAQNALLKTFEEPTPNTHFFIILPNTNILLPTVRSRVVIINNNEQDKIEGQKDNSVKSLAKKFITLSPAERIALIKDLVENKDKGAAIDFVSSLEQELASRLASALKDKNSAEVQKKLSQSIAETLLVKKYLHDRSPSIKLLLEHLCLVITF